MTCPSCGTENVPGATSCSSCGTVLTGDADTEILPPPPAPPGAPPGQPAAHPPVVAATPGPLGAAMSRGWATAAGSAALTFAIMLLVGEGLAALLYAAGGTGSIGDVVRIGALFTYSFHRVGVSASLPDFSPGEELTGGQLPGTELSLQITFAIAMLLGTILLFWLLWRAGRALGAAAGGPAWVRGLSGARVAVPYFLITGVGALLLSLAPLSFDVPEIPGFPGGGSVELSPAVAAAFLWPLVIAAVAGFAGGVTSRPVDVVASGRAEVLGPAAVSGGLAMVGWGVLFGFLGFEILSFVHGDVALPFNPEYVDGVFGEGALPGLSALAMTLMFVPNLGALVLVPAMGSSLGLFGGGVSFPLLSYLKFPTGFDPGALAGLSGLGTPGAPPGELVQTQVAPAGYWAFLLVPLLATVLGGRAAARRSGAASAGAGATAGALAGVVYGLLVTVVAVMAGVGFHVDATTGGISQSQGGHIGANLAMTLLLGLLWGIAGGALGGMLGARRDAAAAVPVPPGGYGFDTAVSTRDPGADVPTPPSMGMPGDDAPR